MLCEPDNLLSALSSAWNTVLGKCHLVLFLIFFFFISPYVFLFGKQLFCFSDWSTFKSWSILSLWFNFRSELRLGCCFAYD